MKIVIAADKAYSRAIKLSECLLKKGHEVIFLVNAVKNSYVPCYMDMGMLCGYSSKEEFIKQLCRIQNIDLIFAQNFTSWHGHVAKKARPDVPMIFDIQDSARTIFSQPELDEDETIKYADGITLLCEFYRDEIPRVSEKNNIVFYSFLPESHFPKATRPSIDAICYEGAANGVKTEGQHWHWRDFRSVCAHLADNDVPVFMQHPDLGLLTEYNHYGAIGLPPLPSRQMIEQMTAFSWGICGYDINGHGEVQKNGYLPNKLFEYIAAGLPIISYNTKAVGEFIHRHGIGVVANTKDEIVDIFKNKDLQKKLKSTLESNKHNFTMEKQIYLIEDFFLKTIERCKNDSTK